MRRARYQNGYLKIERRERGPDVWVHRWREIGPNGARIHRKAIVGTCSQFPTRSAAQQAIGAQLVTINNRTPRALNVTLASAVEHYRQHELADEHRRAHSTRQIYGLVLKNWIVPRWGDILLDDVDPVAVESWLRQLAIADGSKVKIRNVMSSVFSHALRNKLMAGQANPIALVRQSGKRKRVPEYLEASELKCFLGGLEQRERTLVFLDAGTGLRVSELLALKWDDVDFENKLLHVRRSIVQQVIGSCKTEASKKPVPLDACLVEDLRRWRSVSFFNRPSDWVFASPRMAGRQPYWPDSLLRRVIRPAALKAGITKRIGWHTFRHSFSTLLRANGEDIKVVQELLRHANSRTTLDLYTQAPSNDKRKAQARAVRKFAPKRKAVSAGTA